MLPVRTVSGSDEAVELINEVCDRPLALYIFAEDSAVVESILSRTTSGGVCVNSTIEHIAGPHLPFGGVGESGMGAYHGKFGFDEFSHSRSVLYKDTTFSSGATLPLQEMALPFGMDMYDMAVKGLITGFVSDQAAYALKLAGVAAAGILGYSALRARL